MNLLEKVLKINRPSLESVLGVAKRGLAEILGIDPENTVTGQIEGNNANSTPILGNLSKIERPMNFPVSNLPTQPAQTKLNQGGLKQATKDFLLQPSRPQKTFPVTANGKTYQVSEAFDPGNFMLGTGAVKGAGKLLKVSSTASKKELAEIIDYIRLKQPFNQLIEENIGKYAERFGINSKQYGAIANKLEGVLNNSKTIKSTDVPKTVRVWRKNVFSDGGGYVDVPVIRKEENITLYQGGNPGDGRQFWTPNKKYAEQFGTVKEKTGAFYRVDNGNRVTDVYVEAPSRPKPQLKDMREKANKKLTLPDN